jgi:hypothetical protein
LFAEEARAKGLFEKTDAVLYGKEKIGRLYQLHKLYTSYLVESLPIDELAVESYYLAYPEKFGIKNESTFDKDNQQVNVLDSEKKEWIWKKILAAKKTVLIENEFQRLKEKYHVKLQ